MKKMNLAYTGKTLFNQMSKGKINFDCAVQRGLVWKADKKSLLIHSMLSDYPIPPFYFIKNEDNDGYQYDCIDGKQRSNAIYTFMHGDYELDTEIPVIYDDEGNEEDISGATFDKLPEWAQDRIRDYNLTCYYFDDITDAEIHEMFRRLNNGKALTAVELTRVKAVSLLDFQEMAKHKAIDYVTTTAGKAKFNDENTAMQIYAMAYMPELAFSTKEFRPYIEDAVVTDEQKTRIMSALDYMTGLLTMLNEEGKDNKENARVLRKVKSRTHFVAITYYAMRCADAGRAQERFNETVYDFFKVTATSVSDDYNGTVGAGSARSEAVQKRKAVMDSLPVD